MQRSALLLALVSALLVAGCSDPADTGGSGDADGASIALDGAGWDGGAALDPAAASDDVRVVAFLKPT